jgi:hypothetical protein
VPSWQLCGSKTGQQTSHALSHVFGSLGMLRLLVRCQSMALSP